jgi:hypothetical protein
VIDKAYFLPELLTSNDCFFDDQISKLDGERVFVYSLGFCVLHSALLYTQKQMQDAIKKDLNLLIEKVKVQKVAKFI